MKPEIVITMLKYNDVRITFQEIPDEVSLTFSITGCPHNCDGCHSPELRTSHGIDLTIDNIIGEVKKHRRFITNILFLGGDHNKIELLNVIVMIRALTGFKVSLYTGSDEIDLDFYNNVDYLKIGHYDKEKGPLTSKTTNQCLINTQTGEDLTHLFWKE